MPGDANSLPVLRNNMRLAPLSAGSVIGPRKGNMLIAMFNALMAGRINLIDAQSGAEGASFSVTENNMAWNIPKAMPGDGEGSGASIRRFKIKTDSGLPMVLDDYYVCNYWDGTTEGAEVNVARPFKLQASITDETIAGIDISYTYSTPLARIASATGYDNEAHVVVPYFLVDDEILAVDLTDAGGTDIIDEDDDPVVWMDLNVDGRAWCQVTSDPIP